MVDFSCSFVSVCKLRKPLGGASSKLRSPHAPPKNPLRWARLAVACRTSVAEGRLTSCSPSAKARRKRLSATACPQQALCPQRGQQPVSRGRRGGARGGDDGLRNYECFPSSHLPHAKCSPWKGKTACEMPLLERKSTAACEMPLLERKSTAACEMLPPGKGKPHAKCSLPERDSLPIDFMLE